MCHYSPKVRHWSASPQALSTEILNQKPGHYEKEAQA
jgi:hypothetical protein